MARTVTRVELFGRPSEADYEQLHAAMARVSFVRFITGSDRSRCQMPSAMYYSEAYTDETQATNAAAQVAAAIWKEAGVISTCGNSAWLNLRPA